MVEGFRYSTENFGNVGRKKSEYLKGPCIRELAKNLRTPGLGEWERVRPVEAGKLGPGMGLGPRSGEAGSTPLSEGLR